MKILKLIRIIQGLYLINIARADEYRIKRRDRENFRLRKELTKQKETYEDFKRITTYPPSPVPDFTGRDLRTGEAEQKLVQSRKRRWI